ncbi:MAG: ParA family protein [Phycisphaerales bacterium]|nr:MAG: ParA family protein [Phycisphaerales bacterium]
MRTISLLNQKGGVGKTTTTANLGAALAAAGQRVLLIDLDPQAHLTLHLGIEPDQVNRTVYDLLVESDVTAEDAVISARENIDIIVAEVDLAAAESELAGLERREQILREQIRPIANRYDVIMIDCPPSLGLLTLNALAMSREVFVPMQAHFLALQGVSKLLETVGLVCRSVNPDLRVTGIVLCMHEGQTTLAKEVVDDLESFLEQARGTEVPWRDCRVLKPAVRRNIKLAEAPSFGQTILDYEPWCPGAMDYRNLADNLLKSWTAPAREAVETSDDEVDENGGPEIITLRREVSEPAETDDITTRGTSHQSHG